MREFLRFWRRRYSAVSTGLSNGPEFNQRKSERRKSLADTQALQGFSILDSFFYKRKDGERARWPKSKINNYSPLLLLFQDISP